ncbi:MAG: VOC family protein [Gallionella sp.]
MQLKQKVAIKTIRVLRFFGRFNEKQFRSRTGVWNSGTESNFRARPLPFQVNCETQEEVDYYWERLSVGGDEKAQQCGWLKDKYGVSWQVVPGILPKLLNAPDYEKSQKVMGAMLLMKKIDIDALKRAYGE